MPQQSKLSVRYRAGFSGVAVVLLLLMISVPVLADGNGATHDYYTHCFQPGGVTICATYDILTHETVTPSGNVSYFTHYTNSSTISLLNGTLLSSSVTQQEFHSLTKEGIEQVLANHVTTTSTYSFNGQTCTSILEYHLVKGEVQFYRYESQCS